MLKWHLCCIEKTTLKVSNNYYFIPCDAVDAPAVDDTSNANVTDTRKTVFEMDERT